MRILQVVHAFLPESVAGTELCTYYLSKELIREGHELSVFTASPKVDGPRYHVSRETYDGLEVARIYNRHESEADHLRTFINFRVEENFRDYVEGFCPDIVHIQHLHGLSTSIIQALLEMSIPMVFTAHDYWCVCPRIQLLDRNMELCSGPMEGYKCGRCVADFKEDRDEGESKEDTQSQASRQISIKRIMPAKLKHKLKTMLVPEVDEISKLRTEIESLKQGIATLYSSTDYFVGRYNFMVSMLNKVGQILTPSFHTKRKFVELGLPEDRIRVVPHGLDVESFRKSIKKGADTIRVAYFGGLVKHKGIEVLLKAFSNIPRSKASLLVLGSGYDAEYNKYLARLTGTANVVFRGRYDHDQMPEILSEVDVIIVPSVWEETFNLIVREGFLTDTPVIASRIGALEEAINDGVDGFLVEPGNVNELRQKLHFLVSNPEILQQLRAGIKPVKDLAQHASEIESIYTEIILEHRQRAQTEKRSGKNHG